MTETAAINISEVLFVIPTWNRSASALAIVASIRRWLGASAEVLVVDDGSRTAHVQRLIAGSSLRLFELIEGHHCGLNQTRNRGVEWAQRNNFRYVAFMDDDELLTEEWWGAIAAALAESPLSCVGGPVKLYAPPRVRSCATCASEFGSESPTSESLLGGNMVIPIQHFSSVGYFDATLSGHGDETEWFSRARRADVKIKIAPDAIVWHVRDQTLRNLAAKHLRQGLNLGRTGSEISVRHPSASVAAKSISHAMWHGCGVGLIGFVDETASLLGAATRLFRPRK